MKAYIKTKWLSYKHNLPFFYQPFEYSDQLMLSRVEQKWNKEIEQHFTKVIFLGNDPHIIIDRNAKYIYAGDFYTNVEIDFNDIQFMSELKKAIAPINPIEKPFIPSDRISVAVHVRRGGGYDAPLSFEKESPEKTGVNGSYPETYPPNECFIDQTSYLYRMCNPEPMQVHISTDGKNQIKNTAYNLPQENHDETYADLVYPGKFLQDKYFIDQIDNLYRVCNEKPMHVHIFTDDKNPNRFIKKYKKALDGKNITFSSRGAGNYKTTAIDDFFSMAHYDCLIMPDSGFSWCVKQILADFFIVISYKDNQVTIEVNQKNFNKIAKHVKNIRNLNLELFNQDYLYTS